MVSIIELGGGVTVGGTVGAAIPKLYIGTPLSKRASVLYTGPGEATGQDGLVTRRGILIAGEKVITVVGIAHRRIANDRQIRIGELQP